MLPLDFLQLGVAGGALAVLVVMGRYFFRQVKELTSHQERQQNQILEFFGNHMTENVRAQQKVSSSLDGLTGEIRAMRYERRARGEIDSRVESE